MSRKSDEIRICLDAKKFFLVGAVSNCLLLCDLFYILRTPDTVLVGDASHGNKKRSEKKLK